MATVKYQSIGTFHCRQSQPVESPRQGILASSHTGYIQLHKSFPQEAVRDLDGFERVWLIYDFHGNKNWRPTVLPPRGGNKKRGVLATRSPYRPNSIGMSCVLLKEIKNHRIHVAQHDLLDGTPILDIKPYLSYADSFPQAHPGWLADLKAYTVDWSESALSQTRWLSQQLDLDMVGIVESQLCDSPTLAKRKRVKATPRGYEFAYRTWRWHFSVEGRSVSIQSMGTGYSLNELGDSHDPYHDKALHQSFVNDWPSC